MNLRNDVYYVQLRVKCWMAYEMKTSSAFTDDNGTLFLKELVDYETVKDRSLANRP